MATPLRLPRRSGSLVRVKPNLERLEPREVPSITVSTPPNWTEIGPSLITGGQADNIAGNNPVIGAVSTLAAHPTDANIMFAGTPNGGVWRTANAQAASPNWSPLTDGEASLSVSSISIDPANPNRMVVGYGLTADGIEEDPLGTGLRGDLIGLLFTDNALAAVPTWTALNNNLAGKNVTSLILRQNFIVVGTDAGLFVSNNNGATFTNTHPATLNNGTIAPFTFDQRVFDLTSDSRLANQIYAATGGTTPRVWRSDDFGQSWGDVTDPQMQLNARTVNVKLTTRYGSAIDNQVYVVVSNDLPVQESNEDHLPGLIYFDFWKDQFENATHSYSGREGQVVSISWSTNQGGDWTRMDAPKTEAARYPIYRLETNGTGAIIKMDPLFNDDVPHRLKTGDVVRIEDVWDSDPTIPGSTAVRVLTSTYFVEVINEYEFRLVGENYTGTIWRPNPVFVFPDEVASGTWTRLVNANPGENSQFVDIVSSPNAPNAVYLGGDSAVPSFFGNANNGATSFTGSLWIGNRLEPADPTFGAPSKDFSTQWTTITNEGVDDGSTPPADTREMIFDASGGLWVATGGGIYRRSDPSNTATSWVNKNGDLRIGQFWDAAYDTASGTVVGATQDTGAIEQVAGGGSTYNSVFSTALRNEQYDQEDSYLAEVDNVGFVDRSIHYLVQKDFSKVFRRVFDTAGNLLEETVLNFGSTVSPGSFLAGISLQDYDRFAIGQAQLTSPIPIALKLNQIDSRRGIYGRTSVYEDSDPNGVTGAIVNNVTPPGMTGHVTAFEYGGKRNGVSFNQVLFVGTSTGQVFRRGEFGTAYTELTLPGTGAITDIAKDPDNWRNVFIARGGRVYGSTDGGDNWNDLNAGLVDVPEVATGEPFGNALSTQIRSLALYDANPGTTSGGVILVAGGRNGVFRQRVDTVGCGGATWEEYGRGLPNSVITSLEFQGNRLVAGTFGRGVWTIGNVDPSIVAGTIVTVTGTSGADTILVTADPANPFAVIVDDGSSRQSIELFTLDTIVINTLGGADRVIVDSNGLANGGNVRFLKTPINANFGGDAGDVLLVNAESDTTNNTVTITDDSIGGFAGNDYFGFGCTVITYSGLQNGELYVNAGLASNLINVDSLMTGRNIFYAAGGFNTFLFSAGISGSMDLVTRTGTSQVVVVGTPLQDYFTLRENSFSANSANANYFGRIQTTSIQGQGNDDYLTVIGKDSATNFGVNQTGLTKGSVSGLPSTAVFELIPNITVLGGPANDSIRWRDLSNTKYGTVQNPADGVIYSPLSETSGVLRFGGVGTNLRFVGLNGEFAVNGDSSNSDTKDVLTVTGVTDSSLVNTFGEARSSAPQDAITATDAKVSISNAALGQLKPITIDPVTASKMSFSSVFVRAGNEVYRNPGDTVTASPTLRTNLVVDGGDPVRVLPVDSGDQITVVVNGRTTVFQSTDPAFGPNQTRVTESKSSASVGYFNFEDESIQDSSRPPLPPVVPGVPPVAPPPQAIKQQIFAVGTDAGVASQVKVYNTQDGSLRYDISPFGAFSGGVTVASGDITGDGFADFVAGAGPGGGPQVSIYDGATGKLVRSFFAFSRDFRGGVSVAVGDVNGDGLGDVIVGAGAGGGPRVTAFDGVTGKAFRDFFAYVPSFSGGIRVASGDVDGDGFSEIITGAGAGGGPHVQVFSGKSSAVIRSFFAYTPTFSAGIFVAAGDVDGDGRADVITGAGVGGGPHVQVFSGFDSTNIRSFFAGEPSVPGAQPISIASGVRVAAFDQNGDGLADILAGRGKGVRPLAQIVRVSRAVNGLVAPTLETAIQVNAFGDTYQNGIFVG